MVTEKSAIGVTVINRGHMETVTSAHAPLNQGEEVLVTILFILLWSMSATHPGSTCSVFVCDHVVVQD